MSERWLSIIVDERIKDIRREAARQHLVREARDPQTINRRSLRFMLRGLGMRPAPLPECPQQTILVSDH